MTPSSRQTGQTSLVAGVSALLLSLFPEAASAQESKEFRTEKNGVTVETVADGLAQPWSVEVLPDNAYIITELPGNLRIVRNGKAAEPISGLPEVAVAGQGGLLDVALDAGFATNRTLYLTMAVAGDGGNGTAVYSAALSADEKQLMNAQELFRMNRLTGKGQHFGSRIAIAKDGSLFFGIGDRGEGDRAQDMQDHAGAILHINADGSIPADNPYADGKAGLPELWSKGHRNPQGITIDPKDGKLLTVEHGARGGDEVNTPEPGKNYGWPVITFGKDYSGAAIGEGSAKDGYEQPLYYWDPSIAPGAIVVYRGAMFPEWDGDLLVCALKYQLLARLDRDETGKVIAEERILDEEYGRIRDVSVAPDGSVLLVTDGEDGALLRLSKTPTQ
ncbi:PQQ-dependent sugar dehydrogenase [Pararhizobium sp.]|uniref:PQQ-dependent sugar dehydrogenase n=1 Tax=Pararhizobium sp. TaxID=1977563 RepID=UPI00271CC948|nr:PQQ-dependent sugar dehydrogenase [Pararhizobium sp.]MDO9414770.1 PQQ-dependent sugar dehydrogenase [Pararhizobium sp.]